MSGLVKLQRSVAFNDEWRLWAANVGPAGPCATVGNYSEVSAAVRLAQSCKITYDLTRKIEAALLPFGAIGTRSSRNARTFDLMNSITARSLGKARTSR